MKSALMIDCQICTPLARQQLVTALIIALVIALPMGNLYSIIPTFALVITVSLSFTLMALDEQNGWQAYRAALPVTRKDIMAGRTLFVASVALLAVIGGVVLSVVASAAFPVIEATWGQIVEVNAESFAFDAALVTLSCGFSLAIISVMSLITMPLVAKFGMTKAIRYVPLAFCVLIVLLFGTLGTTDVAGEMASGFTALLESNPVPSAIVLAVLAACLFAICGALSGKLYESRQF